MKYCISKINMETNMNIVIMLHWKIIELSWTITTTLIQIRIIKLRLIIITRLAITISETLKQEQLAKKDRYMIPKKYNTNSNDNENKYSNITYIYIDIIYTMTIINGQV